MVIEEQKTLQQSLFAQFEVVLKVQPYANKFLEGRSSIAHDSLSELEDRPYTSRPGMSIWNRLSCPHCGMKAPVE